MYNPLNQPTLTTVFDSAYSFACENVFFKNFTEHSKAGDDKKIIEIIRGIPDIEKLTMKENYVSKSNEEAKNFLKEAEKTDKNEKKLSYLIKALFAAEIESDERKRFFDTLICTIRDSFASEDFEKCLKYCRYMINSILNNQIYANSKENVYKLYKIECLSHETRCLKILGYTEEAKSLARNGIREAKNYFQKLKQQQEEEGGAAISDEKKLEKLRPFLNVLDENGGKNLSPKKCAVRKTATIETRKISMPEVFGKRNNRLKSCSDAVELRCDETRGRHLVATRNIKIGSVLIFDQPFAWSTDKNMLRNNCLHCHKSINSHEDFQIPCHNCQTVKFCSEECRIESWEKYHRWECIIFDNFYRMQKNESSRLLLAYRTTVSLATGNAGDEDDRLSPELMSYYRKKTSGCGKLEIPLNEEYDASDYRTVYSLATNGKNIDPKINLMHAIHGVLLAKCFRFVSEQKNPKIEIGDDEEIILATATLHHLQAINANAYEIVENVLDTERKIWEPRTVGGAIYPTVSLTNHSCFPNVVRHTYPKGNVAVRSIRSIRKGEEILDCYGPHYLRDVKSERQEYLMKKYHFNCVCEGCDNNLGPVFSPALYKCKYCSNNSEKLGNTCDKCGARLDRVKTDKLVRESMQRRSIALQKMWDRDHVAALPILLRHAELVNKIYADSSFEAVKTQQALIQCLNSMGCISK